MDNPSNPTNPTGPTPTAGSLRDRFLPILVLAAWIAATGVLLWLRSQQSVQPPLNEPLSYMQKAQGVWQAIKKGSSFNPFDVAPAHRPPGTVLLSYPLGFDPDPRGFYFRSLFMPFLLWTAAILLVLWPVAPPASARDRWRPYLGALLFGPAPAFFQFEFPTVLGSWGMMDPFLGSVGALAIAALDRGWRLRSRRWVATGITLACCTLLVKPAGGLIIGCGILFLLMAEAVRHGRDSRSGKAYDPYPLATGLVILWLVGGGLFILSLQSKYLDPQYRETVEGGAFDTLRGLLGYGRTGHLLQAAWALTGPVWLLLGGGFALLRSRRIRVEPDVDQGVRMAFATITLLVGLYYGFVHSGGREVGHLIPFACCASIPLVGSFFPRLHDGLWPAGRRWLIVGCLAVAVNTLLLLSVRNPPVAWQQLSGVGVEVARTEPPGVSLGHRLADSLERAGLKASVRGLGRLPESVWFEVYGNYRRLRDSGRTGYWTHSLASGNGRPAIRLQELVYSARYILVEQMADSTSDRWLAAGRQGAASIESDLLQALFSRLGGRHGVRVVDSSGRLRLVRVVAPRSFAAAFDSILAGVRWDESFRKENLDMDGRLQLTDPFAEPAHAGPLVIIQGTEAGNLERVEIDPGTVGTLLEGTRLSVVGWVVPDQRKDSAVGDVFLILEKPGEPTRYIPTEKLVRDDLVSAFGRPGYRMAGYHAGISVDGLMGTYTLGIAVLSDGRLYRLPRYDRPLRIGTD
jgi:hypothetical protein